MVAPGGRVTMRVTLAAVLGPLLLKVTVKAVLLVATLPVRLAGPVSVVATSATGVTVTGVMVAVSLLVAPFWLVAVPTVLVAVMVVNEAGTEAMVMVEFRLAPLANVPVLG